MKQGYEVVQTWTEVTTFIIGVFVSVTYILGSTPTALATLCMLALVNATVGVVTYLVEWHRSVVSKPFSVDHYDHTGS